VAAVVFLYQITVFLQQHTTASLLELYFNDSMQTVYTRGGDGGGSQQREVADGADVVFTDTVTKHCITCTAPKYMLEF